MKKLSLLLVPAATLLLALGTHSLAETPEYTCHKKVKPTNAQLGKHGQYDVKNGLQTKKTLGFVERSKVKPTNKCFFGGLTSGQCVVAEFDAKGWDALKFERQCVVVETGAEFRAARPLAKGHLKPQAILTKCPNKTGYPCDAGDNRARSEKYTKALAKKGKKMWSFCAHGAYNSLDKNIGKKVFCQMFDKKSGTVVFATEFEWQEIKLE